MDILIAMLGRAERFAFPDVDALLLEVSDAGGVPEVVERAYGGNEEGVNVLFTVRAASTDPVLGFKARYASAEVVTGRSYARTTAQAGGRRSTSPAPLAGIPGRLP
jgi:hypothetical protein